MLYINRVACHDPFCLFGFNLDSCTVFRQSTVAEASLLLFNDLSRIENDLEMMFPRFFSAGCRIKSLYRSTSAVFLQLFPFPPTSHNAHSRKRKVAGTTGDNIQKDLELGKREQGREKKSRHRTTLPHSVVQYHRREASYRSCSGWEREFQACYRHREKIYKKEGRKAGRRGMLQIQRLLLIC